MATEYWKPFHTVLAYEYDFAVSGGAQGTFALGNLPDNFCLTDLYLIIETTITSGGTPTIIIGEDGSGDADGYFADFFGTPTAGVTLKGGGALITDGIHRVAAAKDGILMTVGTADLTAGKFKVYARGFQS